jgi:hypothetical protein
MPAFGRHGVQENAESRDAANAATSNITTHEYATPSIATNQMTRYTIGIRVARAMANPPALMPAAINAGMQPPNVRIGMPHGNAASIHKYQGMP